uniref:Uncharacterized protein n=1 Tax=uncultured bacterium A1Q1_fos_2037 TaxID=1256558 RepID=L7VYC0_9BACT|nr:hypothetical protein [uncultured bacterium A1Q1_fos_2037]
MTPTLRRLARSPATFAVVGALLAGGPSRGGQAPVARATADAGTRERGTAVTFAFAPPPGTSYRQREIFIETARLGGVQRRVSLASEVSVDISHEAGRYFLRYRIDRAAAARDGKASDAAMVAALAGGETVNIVRPDGVMAKIDGLRRLHERLLPTLPAEERAALTRRLRESRLEDRSRAAWFEATEILAGQTLELGRDYFFDAAWPTDEGWIRHQTLLRLGPWEPTPHGRRLRLQLAYVDDAREDLPAAVRLEPRSPGGFAPAAPGRIARGFRIAGNASRLVDPSTLLVWRDQTVRQIRNRVEVSEELAVTVSSEEKTDITLEPAPRAPEAPPANP